MNNPISRMAAAGIAAAAMTYARWIEAYKPLTNRLSELLKSFLRDLHAGMEWIKDEIARPVPAIEPSRRTASCSRRSAPAVRDQRHDDGRHHHQAYDADAFSSDSSGGEGGGGD